MNIRDMLQSLKRQLSARRSRAAEGEPANQQQGKSFLDSPDMLWYEQPVEEVITYVGNARNYYYYGAGRLMNDQDLSACLAAPGPTDFSKNSGLIRWKQTGPRDIKEFSCKIASCKCMELNTLEARQLYEKLPSTDHIRIIELLPGTDEIIECYLHLARLPEDQYTYQALSYTWTPDRTSFRFDERPEHPSTQTIRCNGQVITVGYNLFTALKRVRDIERRKFIWVDALCINQNDLIERGQQVQRMGIIFESAFRVIIWLDDAPTESKKFPVAVHKTFAYRAFSAVCNIVNNWREQSELDDIIFPATHTPGIVCLTPNSSGDLMSPESIEWHAVFQLYQCKWFRRIWVIQEAARARAAVVLWDDCEISWDNIGLAAAIIRTNFGRISASIRKGKGSFLWNRESIPRRTVPTGVVNAYFMYRLSRSQHYSESLTFTFHELLKLTRQFECKDERDRIFGLLGLPTTDNVSIGFQPDYSKSTQQVYFEVAEKILESSSSLSLLSSVQPSVRTYIPEYGVVYDSRNRAVAVANDSTPSSSSISESDCLEKDWPTWVPQWQFMFTSSLSPPYPHRSFAPSATRQALRLKRDNNRQLILRGVIVDKILHSRCGYMFSRKRGEKTADQLFGNHWKINQDSGEHDLYHIVRSGRVTKAKLESLALILTAGKNWYGLPVENRSAHLADYAKCLFKEGCLWSLQDDFIFSNADAEEHGKSKDNKSKPKALLNDSLSMKDLEALSKDGNADRFLDAFVTVCNRRSLFKTTTGLKGVGPECLEEGDQICVLYGATVPFVIRSDGTGGFLLVGECYVHDIMSGEVIQQLGNPRNGLKETWIPLS